MRFARVQLLITKKKNNWTEKIQRWLWKVHITKKRGKVWHERLVREQREGVQKLKSWQYWIQHTRQEEMQYAAVNGEVWDHFVFSNFILKWKCHYYYPEAATQCSAVARQSTILTLQISCSLDNTRRTSCRKRRPQQLNRLMNMDSVPNLLNHMSLEVLKKIYYTFIVFPSKKKKISGEEKTKKTTKKPPQKIQNKK